MPILHTVQACEGLLQEYVVEDHIGLAGHIGLLIELAQRTLEVRLGPHTTTLGKPPLGFCVYGCKGGHHSRSVQRSKLLLGH